MEEKRTLLVEPFQLVFSQDSIWGSRKGTHPAMLVTSLGLNWQGFLSSH
jgi:hypothetical protein